MRVATLYDIHGNLRALDAVLREVPGEATIVVGGDVCAGGAHPSETLERLRALGERVRWLRGNADRELTPGETGLAPPEVIEATRAALSAEQIAFLYGLQPTVHFDDVLFCHATPRNDLDVFTEHHAGRTDRALLCQRRCRRGRLRSHAHTVRAYDRRQARCQLRKRRHAL